MNKISNFLLLKELHKSIKINQYLIQLNIFAFFFLPLTFMHRIFEINFKEFEQKILVSYIFFILVMLFDMLLYF